MQRTDLSQLSRKHSIYNREFGPHAYTPPTRYIPCHYHSILYIVLLVAVTAVPGVSLVNGNCSHSHNRAARACDPEPEAYGLMEMLLHGSGTSPEERSSLHYCR
jgi:hypothetical protein